MIQFTSKVTCRTTHRMYFVCLPFANSFPVASSRTLTSQKAKVLPCFMTYDSTLTQESIGAAFRNLDENKEQLINLKYWSGV